MSAAVLGCTILSAAIFIAGTFVGSTYFPDEQVVEVEKIVTVPIEVETIITQTVEVPVERVVTREVIVEKIITQIVERPRFNRTELLVDYATETDDYDRRIRRGNGTEMVNLVFPENKFYNMEFSIESGSPQFLLQVAIDGVNAASVTHFENISSVMSAGVVDLVRDGNQVYVGNLRGSVQLQILTTSRWTVVFSER